MTNGTTFAEFITNRYRESRIPVGVLHKAAFNAEGVREVVTIDTIAKSFLHQELETDVPSEGWFILKSDPHRDGESGGSGAIDGPSGDADTGGDIRSPALEFSITLAHAIIEEMELHEFTDFEESGGELEILVIGQDIVHLGRIAAESAYIEIGFEIKARIENISE